MDSTDSGANKSFTSWSRSWFRPPITSTGRSSQPSRSSSRSPSSQYDSDSSDPTKTTFILGPRGELGRAPSHAKAGDLLCQLDKSDIFVLIRLAKPNYEIIGQVALALDRRRFGASLSSDNALWVQPCNVKKPVVHADANAHAQPATLLSFDVETEDREPQCSISFSFYMEPSDLLRMSQPIKQRKPQPIVSRRNRDYLYYQPRLSTVDLNSISDYFSTVEALFIRDNSLRPRD
jgi:hypothetical protein